MKQPVYIFDVDGVLNGHAVKEVDVRILTSIADLLEKNAFVAINTGRDYAWVKENIIQKVQSKLQDATALERLFVSAEMGGICVEFPGSQEKRISTPFSLTLEQIAEVKHTFEAHPEHSKTMHWYVGKKSMASVRRNSNVDYATYRPAQQALKDILKKVFKDQLVKVAHSTDAVDVHAPEAGKGAGAQLIYEWLRRVSHVRQDHYMCFGDSIVDYEMARFFARQSHDATFVFSGPSLDGIDLEPGIQVVKTEPQYNEGVYRYLKEMS